MVLDLKGLALYRMTWRNWKGKIFFFVFAKIINSFSLSFLDRKLLTCFCVLGHDLHSLCFHVLWFISKMNRRWSLLVHCLGEVDSFMYCYNKVLDKLGWQCVWGADGGGGQGQLFYVSRAGRQEGFHTEIKLWTSPGICGAGGCCKQLYEPFLN